MRESFRTHIWGSLGPPVKSSYRESSAPPSIPTVRLTIRKTFRDGRQFEERFGRWSVESSEFLCEDWNSIRLELPPEVFARCGQGVVRAKQSEQKMEQSKKSKEICFTTGAKGCVWFSGAKELVYNRSKGFSLCLLCLLYEKQEQTARSA